MTTIIDDRIIEEVKARADIVDIIGKYVDLKKKGSSYMGLCPFHKEKTPSFSVNDKKGFYKCFGCGESGDVLSFIMKKENLPFTEAVTKLAEEYHIVLEKRSPEDDRKIKKRELFYEMNRQAAIYYMKLLSRNKHALEYLNRRGFDKSIIVKFGIGFAPSSGVELLEYLKGLGYKTEDIYANNLISKNEKRGNYFDRFRNRIIFPIIDTRSRVLGFGGRVLDDSLPKYLNSSETEIFHKGSNLYGLNIVQKESDRNKILLVEGYMDVISLYKHGINFAIASLGTALTREQAKLIKRFGKEIYICYDGDTAGIRATNRAINVLFQENLRPRIVQLPESLDPDDFLKKYGPIEFEAALKKSISAIDFRIQDTQKNFNLSNPESLAKFLQEVAKIVSSIQSPVEQEVYIDRVAEKYGISRESMRLELGRSSQKGMNTQHFTFLKRDIEEKNTDKIDMRLVQLVYYALESEALFTQMTTNKHWEWLRAFEKNNILSELEEIFNKNLSTTNAIREEFFLGRQELFEIVRELSNHFDLQKAEQIINELMESLFLSGLETRTTELLEKISALEKIEDKDTNQILMLSQALEELSEVSKSLRETKKGGFE